MTDDIRPGARRKVLVRNTGAGDNGFPEGVFDDFDVVEIDALKAWADTAVFDENVLVAVWGGDGTCRAVAEHLVGTRARLLPCPGGTFNHFAHAAQVHSVDDVRSALLDGETREVDVGVAGRSVFLNNASLGWYVDLVARRERYERRMPRKLAKLLSAIVQSTRIHRSTATVDGVAENVWMVWVGNGRYSMALGDLTERSDMSDGVLDVRVLKLRHRLPKLRAFATVVSGRTESFDDLDRRLVSSAMLQVRKPIVPMTLDGELMTLASPVQMRCVPNGLRLLVPRTESTQNDRAKPSTATQDNHIEDIRCSNGDELTACGMKSSPSQGNRHPVAEARRTDASVRSPSGPFSYSGRHSLAAARRNSSSPPI